LQDYYLAEVQGYRDHLNELNIYYTDLNQSEERILANSNVTIARGYENDPNAMNLETKITPRKNQTNRKKRYKIIDQIIPLDSQTEIYKVSYQDKDWRIMKSSELKHEHPQEFIDYLLNNHSH
jgi:hypothetical protein